MTEIGIDFHILFRRDFVKSSKLRRGRADIIHQARAHHHPALDAAGQILHIDIAQLSEDFFFLLMPGIEEAEIILQLPQLPLTNQL